MSWVHTSSGVIVPVQSVGGYRIIYADPAWQYRNNGRGAAENHYRTMSVDELCALPIASLAAADSVLFMWATWPTLPDALRVGAAWGFDYKTNGFVWVKVNKVSPTPFVGLGHWTRGNTEPCLLFVRGDIRRHSKSVQQVILDEQGDALVAPIGRHSAKPAEARTRIEQLMGPTPAKIELFARERVPGWDAWGNEIESDVRLVHADHCPVTHNASVDCVPGFECYPRAA